MASYSIGQPPLVPQPDIVPNGAAQPPAVPPENPPAVAAAGPASAEAQGGPGAGSIVVDGVTRESKFLWDDLPKPKLSLEDEIATARQDLIHARTPQDRNEARKWLKTLQEKLVTELVFQPKPITDVEWNVSQPTRPPIVDRWYYQDVGHIAAPGGVGKTTLLLFQAIHIVLALDVFGYEVRNCDPIVYLTAEDDRATLIARLRLMCQQLELEPKETRVVRNNIHILDVSGLGIKLTHDMKGAIVPTEYVPKLIEKLKPYRPSMIFIDPAVSFGVGESRVNDSEQGLIDAARLIRNELQCGVFYVHHTGKQNAREKTTDQYSGRGGSALADGSRMIHVMQSLTPEEWTAATGNTLKEDESGVVYARPKMTWAPGGQPPLYLKRKGYLFFRYDHINGEEGAKIQTANNAGKIDKFLHDEWEAGTRYTLQNLEATKLVKPRAALREAVEHLIVAGKLGEEEFSTGGKGRPRKILRPRSLP